MVSRFRLIPFALFGPWIGFAAVAVAPIAAQGPLGGKTAADRHKDGHSKLGEAFDEGPRERPTKIDGIGRTTFPITTSKPEVQEWFDQGHTLLHSFWFFEAERSFRWAVKLDPDAPMPYWGLARTTYGDRARAFLREASSRKTARHRARARLHRRVGSAIRGGRRGRRRAQELPARARAPDHQVSRRRRGESALRPRVDGPEPRRHGAPDSPGPGRRREPPWSASLSHPQLGRPGRRAGARELPALRLARAGHRPRPAHAWPHLRRPRHVPRGGHLARFRHARRDRLHGPPHGLPVQHLELRAQPELSQLRAGTARAPERRHPRRPRAACRAARSEAERRDPLQPALAGRGRADACAGEVRAMGRNPGARLDSVGNLAEGSPRPRLRRGAGQDCQEGSVRRDRGGGLRRLEERNREAGERVVQAAVRSATPRAPGHARIEERRRHQGIDAPQRSRAKGTDLARGVPTIRPSSPP